MHIALYTAYFLDGNLKVAKIYSPFISLQSYGTVGRYF